MACSPKTYLVLGRFLKYIFDGLPSTFERENSPDANVVIGRPNRYLVRERLPKYIFSVGTAAQRHIQYYVQIHII